MLIHTHCHPHHYQTTVGRAERSSQSPLQLGQRTATETLQTRFLERSFSLENKTRNRRKIECTDVTEDRGSYQIMGWELELKPNSAPQEGGGVLLALLTVAPRHRLHMAQEKAEYKQQSWVSQRNLDWYWYFPLGNPTCTCTALNRNILAKFISLPSYPTLQRIYYLLSDFDYHHRENGTASDTYTSHGW